MKEKIQALVQFFKDARAELKRVTWPTRREVLVTTGVVIVFSFIIAFMLGFFDYVYTWIIGHFL